MTRRDRLVEISCRCSELREVMVQAAKLRAESDAMLMQPGREKA